MRTLKAVTLAAIALGLLATGVYAAPAPDPAPSFPWPGPTPPEVRDPLMKARFSRWPNEQELKKIEELAPAEPAAKPARPRRVLVWGRLWTHLANAFCQESLKIVGKKSGAFEVVAGDDPRLLLPESLAGFDAIFWNSLHDQQPFLPLNFKELPPVEQAAARELDAKIKESIQSFVESGKGIAAVEGAIAALGQWDAHSEILGAAYNGHYVNDLSIKVEDAASPLTASFGGKNFSVAGTQGYVVRDPYSLESVHLLLSLDLTQMADPTTKPGQEWLLGNMKGQDRVGEYPISWVRRYGKGRVFYVSLGVHGNDYLKPEFLRYLLAGTQFAIGDLQADTTPTAWDRKPGETDRAVLERRLKSVERPRDRASLLRTVPDYADHTAAPLLTAALKDADAGVRVAALAALARLGEAAEVPAAAEALKDRDAKVRAAACRALGRIGGPAAQTAVRPALQDGDPAVREAAAYAVEQAARAGR